ncbi:DUF5133 domain-containing protein [Streptomyces sp. ODS28]|uniref:DUF5133 domain-containing protein n=1 Tax=Streptomyces sp. ODS28 TaxID=3136688 RepID=UPI0031EA9E61
MLQARPEVLQSLLGQREALTLLREQGDGPELRQQVEDVEYTLCVSTGTREVAGALETARRRLAAERRPDDAAHRS